jgi:hypothetical protein
MRLKPVAYRPYADPDDFIREVTDLIWVSRDISHIVDNYEPDSIVHGSLGTINGRDEVIEGSLMRIADTPSRVGQAEDVVWEARGDDAFLSSHLVFSADRIVLDGRQVQLRSRTIANCLYRRGRMVEEWVVRDVLAGCLQRGEDPDEVARQLSFLGYTGSMTRPALPDVLSEGDSGPRRYAGLRIAVLWKFTGSYSGSPAFGPLTGRPVEVLGVSQFLIQEGRIVREIRVYDEIALRAQINHTRGDEPLVSTNIY